MPGGFEDEGLIPLPFPFCFFVARLYLSVISLVTACLCFIVKLIGVSSLALLPGTSRRSRTSRFKYFSWLRQ